MSYSSLILFLGSLPSAETRAASDLADERDRSVLEGAETLFALVPPSRKSANYLSRPAYTSSAPSETLVTTNQGRDALVQSSVQSGNMAPPPLGDGEQSSFHLSTMSLIEDNP